jgi:hypothetical protein
MLSNRESRPAAIVTAEMRQATLDLLSTLRRHQCLLARKAMTRTNLVNLIFARDHVHSQSRSCTQTERLVSSLFRLSRINLFLGEFAHILPRSVLCEVPRPELKQYMPNVRLLSPCLSSLPSLQKLACASYSPQHPYKGRRSASHQYATAPWYLMSGDKVGELQATCEGLEDPSLVDC